LLGSQGIVEIFKILFEHVRACAERRLYDINKDDSRLRLRKLLKAKVSKDLRGWKKDGKKQFKILFDLRYETHENMSKEDEFTDQVADLLWRRTDGLYSESGKKVLRDDFIRRAIVNRKDEYGNTMLHLATWNSKPEMYDHLVELGADVSMVNGDGLTPFTLSVRFGRWQMYEHIWKRHFTRPYWQFGNVEANVIDYSQFETGLSGLGTALSFRDLEKCIKLLVLKRIADDLKLASNKESGHEAWPDTGKTTVERGTAADAYTETPSDSEADPHHSTIPEAVRRRIRAWCEKRLGNLLINPIFDYNPPKQACVNPEALELKKGLEQESCTKGGGNTTEQEGASWTEKEISQAKPRHASDTVAGNQDTQTKIGNSQENNQHDNDKKESRSDGKIQKYSIHFRSATELITLFRPKGWQEHAQDLMEKQVLRKWANGFYLVHFADTVVPYGVLLLLFGLMWWQRKLSILEHRFWWSATTVVAPTPDTGIEGACGWEAIRQSYSGRLQATLIVYGVPSLLRLAWVQSRLRPTDLDEDLNWKWSWDEQVNFAFMNLESLFHLTAAVLFLIIGISRVTSQRSHDMYDCSGDTLRTEKNCTAIAALVLFFNLFIVCKPYQGLGVLVQTMYRFLLKDVFHFLVMYGMLFVAFMLALQTLHNANLEYLTWMDTTDTILPQVEKAQNLTYLVNDNIPPHASSLLATETALDGCWSKRRTLTDTAFALMEISFGDGLADALEQARLKPYECAGYAPDFLTTFLLVFWVFVTNVLILNMLIAMMNKTFDDEMKRIQSNVLLDLSYRIMRYERAFPEVADQIQRADSDRSLSCFSLQYWTFLVYRPLLVLYCLPEIHFFCYSITYVLPHSQFIKRKGNDDFWTQVQKAITIERIPNHRPGSRSWFFISRMAYKKKLYDSLDGRSRSLIMLVKRTRLWYPPEARINTGESSAPGELYKRKCWDWLICRLEALKAAQIKALVEIKEIPPKETNPKNDGQQQSSV
jgi:hypothetical protein